jgi:citrate synthase
VAWSKSRTRSGLIVGGGRGAVSIAVVFVLLGILRRPAVGASLFGPLHGGANQLALEMLERIRADGGDVNAFVTKVKNHERGVRLRGFGHRVYKNYDPRAKIVKKTADEVLRKLGVNDPLLEIALALEEKVLGDDYFAERELYPNVDFYTGLIYRAMGFPTRMFAVLFALGRLPGWIAHWLR